MIWDKKLNLSARDYMLILIISLFFGWSLIFLINDKPAKIKRQSSEYILNQPYTTLIKKDQL